MRKWRAEHPKTDEQREHENALARAHRKPRTPERIARDTELQAIRRAKNPERQAANSRAYRERHPDRVAETNRRQRERLGPEYWRAWHQKRKRTVIDRYGGRCECCGETEIEFLSMDHINGGGRRERIAFGVSGVFKRLLKSEERLPGFQVLCMNCQFGAQHGRTCPHQLAK